MADELKSWDLPLYRQGLGKLGEMQESFSQQMDKNNNFPSFLAQFLSGGYDTADALKRLSNEGIIRPQSRWNPDTKEVDNPRAQMVADVLSASQLPSIALPLARLGINGLKGLPSVYNAAVSGTTEEGRRNFVKKGGALIGSATIGGGVALNKLFSKEAVPVAKEAAEAVGKKYKFNSFKEYSDDLYQKNIDTLNNPEYGESMDDLLLSSKRYYDDSKDLIKGRGKYSHENTWEALNKGELDMSDLAQMDTEKIYARKLLAEEENAFSPRAKEEAKEFFKKYY